MRFLVVGLALLVGGAACGGGSSRADRAELAALMVEIRESYAATVAAQETVAAQAAEQSAAQVAALEARGARGEPLLVDVDALREQATAVGAARETEIARVKSNHASVLTQLEDAIAGGAWDLLFPYETGAGLTPRGIVASVRDAANAEREQAEGVASRGVTDAP